MDKEISKNKILKIIQHKLAEIRSFLESYGYCSKEIK